MDKHMKFGEYIEILASTGLFGKSKVRFASGLFGAAAINTEFSEEAVKTWINGTRSCNIKRYFPEMKMDDEQFIAYFRKRTKAPGSWKKIQKAFFSKFAAAVETEDICVDLATEDSEVFYWSLLNQFQRIFHLPESERTVKNSVAPMSAPPQNQITSEQMYKLFLEGVHQYKVMDIINRKPAILNREDSASLNVFLSKIDILVPYHSPYDDSLYASMRSFIDALRIQVLTLDANLNNRFSFEDETASINMEDDKDCDEYPNPLGLPELTPELIKSAYDPIGLTEILVRGWGNFRDKMNLLFKDISSWQSKS